MNVEFQLHIYLFVFILFQVSEFENIRHKIRVSDKFEILEERASAKYYYLKNSTTHSRQQTSKSKIVFFLIFHNISAEVKFKPPLSKLECRVTSQ